MPRIGRSVAFALSLAVLAPVAAVPLQAKAAKATTKPARNVAQEERNRQLVLKFYNGVFNDHQVASSASVIVDDYIQHNPGVPDGKAAFVDYFTGYFQKNPAARSRVVHSASDRDLVLLHVHSTNGATDRGHAIVDIFRVKAGKIVEHWDVVQTVPEPSANKNTMF